MSWLKRSDPVPAGTLRRSIQVPRRSILAPRCTWRPLNWIRIPSSRSAASAPSPAICNVWRIGSQAAASRRWRWSRPASTGFRCSRSSTSAASRWCWSMRAMPSTFPAARLTSATLNGCSGCTRMDCSGPASAQKARSQRCVPIYGCANACWTTPPPTSSTCRRL